jgi:hypothetical protein
MTSITRTQNAQGTAEDRAISVVSYYVSVTVGISYQPVVLPFVTRTQSYVRLLDLTDQGTPKPETNNALIIGVATGAGLLVAILAGVAVFLLRGLRQTEADSDDEEDPEERAIRRRNSYEMTETPPVIEEPEEEPAPAPEPILEIRDLDEIANDDLENIGDGGGDEIWI